MPDSGKFKDLYLNSAHTYPCQGRTPRSGQTGWRGDSLLVMALALTVLFIAIYPAAHQHIGRTIKR